MFRFSLILATVVVLATTALGQLRLDPNFTAGVTDGNSFSYVSAIQSDGKVLVGGKFDLANGVAKGRLARLHPDGSLDTTFNPGGAGPNRHVYEIKVLPGGKILIGGAFTAYNGTIIRGVARLNSDGTLDTSFNVGGIGTAGTVHSITVQADGKYLLSGENLSSYNGVTKFSVIRIHPNGSLDTSFTSPFTSPVFVEQTAIQADGKIIAGGQFSIAERQNVVRLNTNGTLDTSFTQTLTSGGIYAVFIDTGNRILVGGDFVNINGVSRRSLARLQPNGSLDTTFDPQFPQGGLEPIVEYLAFRSDGKIIVAGWFYGQGQVFSVRQLNPDGTLDQSFVAPRSNDGGYHVALLPDERIFLTGYFDDVGTPRTGRQNVVRLNPNGTVDDTFNGGLSAYAGVGAVLQQADGKYVVAGDFYRANGSPHRSLVRFNADGSVDESFQSGWGFYQTYYASLLDDNPAVLYLSLAQQADGKLLFLDTSFFIESYDLSPGFRLRRINQDGSPDPTFTLPAAVANGSIYDVLVEPDGKVLIGGSGLGVVPPPPLQFRMLVRLNPDLTLDPTFTHGTSSSSGSGSAVRKILRQPDGKLIVIGSFSNYLGSNRNGAVRLNENGTIDTSFTANGGNYRAVALQSDGKIVVAGNSFITRWNANGTTDSTFNPGSGPNGIVTSIVVQPDGKIVIGGLFTGYNGVSTNKLARLNPDGSLDTSLPSGLDSNLTNLITSAIPTADGQILIGGVFSNYWGVPRNNLAKLDIENPPTPTPTPTQTPIPTPTGSPTPVPSPSPCIGTLAFDPAPEVGTGLSPLSVALGDLNGDGRQDLAAANFGSNNVSIRLGLGDGTFVAAADVSVRSGPRQVLIGDLNGDSKKDLAVVNSSPTGSVSIRLGVGDGTFTSAPDVGVGFVPRFAAMGDLNGDSRHDLAVPDQTLNNVSIRLGVGDGTFTGAPDVAVGQSPSSVGIGDLNGDGKRDLAVTNSFGDNVSIRLGAGDGTFTVAADVGAGPFPRSVAIGDLNSDGRQDLVVSGQVPNSFPSNNVSIRLGNGDGTFTAAPDVSPGQQPNFVTIKDLNGDGKPDVAVANTTSGTVSIRLGRGDGTFTSAGDVYSDSPFSVAIGDLNGDGRPDLAVANSSFNSVSIRLGRCEGPTGSTARFDYDGDNRTDFSVFRPSSGAWYLQRSTAGFQGLQFGAEGDKLTPADYDGDGKTDIAVYRPSAGQWYVLNSATGTVSYPVFGVAEDIPAPGDYDGDGKADLTVFRPSQGTWYRQNSSNGSFFGMQFGATGDVPTVGDFDGDGKNDLGIWRPSNGDWYNLRSADGSVFGERFGQTGDKIAPADYDGDGKTDIAIYRPATGLWVVRNSATATYSYSVFGAPADIPISGDYDGDGKADIGVWRPSDGTWYIQRSSNGSFIVFPWGQNGDRPTPSAYVN